VADLTDATRAPAYLHPDDRMLWDRVQARPPDGELADGRTFRVGDVDVVVVHTPGHCPGGVLVNVVGFAISFT